MTEINKVWNELGVIAASIKKRERTECVNGHPFSGNNLIIQARGSRLCRQCRNNRLRKYRAALPVKEPKISLCISRKKRGIATHCQRGHEQVGDNVKVFESGARKCLICYRRRLAYCSDKKSAQRAAKKAARKLNDPVKIVEIDDDDVVFVPSQKPSIIEFGRPISREEWLRLHGVKRNILGQKGV